MVYGRVEKRDQFVVHGIYILPLVTAMDVAMVIVVIMVIYDLCGIER